jgi:DNA-binding MarR family transcriptional regulator
MSVETSPRSDLATEAWTLMLQFFLAKARPRMMEVWREFDLMPPQQLLLGLLSEPKPMGELAQHMHCDNSNITGIVDRLEERGLVERRVAEADRRVKLVALTEAGDQMRAEVVRRRSEPPPELTALSESELKRLRQVFAKLAA